MFAISCRGSAMILPGLAIAVANLCKMLSRIYAKPFWTAVHNLCIDPTASGGDVCSGVVCGDVLMSSVELFCVRFRCGQLFDTVRG